MQGDPLHIIASCKKGDRRAQRQLYDLYKGTMMGLARRYMRSEVEAEDVLVSGFFKIFKHIDSYKGEGSFEGWMKRVIVNEALMQLRKRTTFHLSVDDDEVHVGEPPNVLHDLQYADIIRVIDSLPDGYRVVFNMYAIEGYKHREIADELGISINTAKSQYLHAKKKLAAQLKKNNNVKHG